MASLLWLNMQDADMRKRVDTLLRRSYLNDHLLDELWSMIHFKEEQDLVSEHNSKIRRDLNFQN